MKKSRNKKKQMKKSKNKKKKTSKKSKKKTKKMVTTFNQLPYSVMNEYILNPTFPLLSKSIYSSIEKRHKIPQFYETRLYVSEDTTQELFVKFIEERPNLREIVFSCEDMNERIKKIPDIRTLVKLKELSIWYSHIKEIPNLYNLIVLDISNTLVTEVPSTLINLEQLYCENTTNVSKIPSTLTKLEHLHCNNTKITEIPSTLILLITLECFETKIMEIPDSLINLEVLECSYTEIKEIPYTLIKLINLVCHTTNVSEIPYTLTSLEFLECSPQTVIPDNITKNLSYLKYLT